jgi:hypothetical protein
MSTYIGASAEPVLFFSISFSSFFYTYMGYPLRPHAQPDRRSLFDRDFAPRFRLLAADGSTVTSMADRPS